MSPSPPPERLHLPLEVGDIFLKKGVNGGKDHHYVLIAQPCDLMVRGDGKRGNRGAEEAVLCEISEKYERASFELKYWKKGSRDSAWVNLAARHTVNPCMLDPAVFSDKGETRLGVHDKASSALIPAWQERFRVLQNRANQIISNYKLAKEKKLDDQHAKLIIPSVSIDGSFRASVDINAGTVDFGLQRVARIRQPWSVDVLRAYTLHMARAAYDVDLGHDLS